MRSVFFVTHSPTPYRSHIYDWLAERPEGFHCKVLYWTRPDPLRGMEGQPALRHPHVILGESVQKLSAELRVGRPSMLVIGGLTAPFAYVSIAIANLLGIPYGIHSESHSMKVRPLSKEAMKWLAYWALLRRASAVFPTSTPARAYLRKYMGRDVPCAVFPNAPDPDHFAREVARFRAGASSLPIWTDPPRLLYVGRLIPQKGVATLLRAWHHAESRGIAAELQLVGDGPLRSQLEELAAGLSLQRASFEGTVRHDGLHELYARAHGFVLPSREEPYGAVVNEALSSGLPLILSDRVGCFPDTLVDGRNGFCVAADDPRALGEWIVELFSSRARWESMCRASLDIAGRFRTGVVAEGIQAVIREVLEGWGGRGFVVRDGYARG